jgi:hypothetical protein
MRKSLKINILILLSAISLCANAQKYAIQGGYVNPIRYGSNVSSTFYYGGQIGGTVNFDLKNNMSLLTGALYNFVYANKIQGYPSTTSVTYKTYGHFLDIPVHFMYSIPLFKNVKIFGYAGPNINIGLSQKQETISTLTYPETNPLYIPNDKKDLYTNSILNRFNLQIGTGGGVQWKKYQIKSGYNFGILNLDKVNTTNQYQNGWFVSFVYEF